MRLNLIHQDQVNPESLSKDFVNIGSSDLCEVQGIYKRGRVLTLQGHAEFDTDMVIEFGKPILGKAMDISREQSDDHGYAASAILGFLREEAAGEGMVEEGVVEEVVGEAAAEEAEEEVEEAVEEAAAAAEEAEEAVRDGELIEEVAWDSLSALFQNLSVKTRGECAGDSGAREALGDTNN
jgi:hypothetical protein